MAARIRALVIIGAALAGLAAGTLGHAVSQRSATGSTAPTQASAAATPTSLAPSSTRASTTASSPTKRSPKPSPTTRSTTATRAASTATKAPAFTEAALLLPAEFMERGWGTTSVTRSGPGFGPEATLCALLGDTKLQEAYTAMYQGRQTTAGEQVGRYRDAGAASAAVAAASAAAPACDWSLEEQPAPSIAGADEALLWYGKLGEERAVVGVVRVGDRALMLSLRSATSDPVKTTDIESLLTRAGKRLV